MTIEPNVDDVNKPTTETSAEIAILMDRLLRRTHVGVHRKAKAFDRDRIGPGGGMLLLSIADAEPTPMHALARELGRDRSQITRAVQSLENKGLVARRASVEDHRVSLLTLTVKGTEAAAGLRAILAETLGDLLACLTHAETQTLKALLTKALPRTPAD